MALSTKVFNLDRKLEYQVIVDGVWLLPVDPTSPTGKPGVLSFRVRKSLDAPVPVCNVTVNRLPKWALRGDQLEINLGFDGEMARVFNGYVQDRAPGVPDSEINGAGRLFSLYRTVQLSDRDVNGQTVQVAIETLLDYVGITDNRSVPSGGFTLGSASDAILRRATAAQMLQTLMDVEGYRVFEDGAGQVIIRTIDGPGPTAFRTYTTNTTATARIIGGRSREDPNYTRDQVKVVGATVVEGTPPNETSRTISQTATLVGGTIIQPPLPSGTRVDAEFSNHLIDTDAQALVVAQRLLTKYARVPRQTILELPGDPQLELGQTLELDFPELNLEGRLYIHGLEHIVDSSGFKTIVDLRGGDEFGGTVGVNPHAAFTYKVEREVFDNKVWAFVTFDASGSYDPDGTIASYAWADDETTTPEVSTISDSIFTVRIDPTTITGDWTVTLTVTDNDGLTGVVSQVIDVDVGAALVTIPAIFAALDNNYSCSPDGGQTWNDEVEATDIVQAVAARPPDGVNMGQAVWGLSDGSIMRTANFLTSSAVEVKAGNNDAIEDIAWDWRYPDRVWAVDDTLKVWVSSDSGVTWVLIENLRSAFSLGSSSTAKKIGLPGGQPIGVWIHGGDGAGNPAIWYSYGGGGGGPWAQLTFGGELAADLPMTDTAVKIIDAVDKGDGGGLVILLENADGSAKPPIYHTTDPFTPSAWKRATGLDAALKNGRYVVVDELPGEFHAAFDDRDVWSSTDGIAWTKAANIMPANVVPHHAIRVSDYIHGLFTSSVYLIAAENTSDQSAGIYKSADGLASVGLLRPATGFDAWPSGAIGRKLAVGSQSPVNDQLLVVQSEIASNPQVYERDTATLSGGIWTKQEDGASISQKLVMKVKKLGNNHYRLIAENSTTTTIQGPVVGQLQRSTDDGLNWSNVGPTPKSSGGQDWGVSDFEIAADGVLWLCATSRSQNTETDFEPKIYKSVNDGVTWTFVWQETTQTSLSWEFMWRLQCHPIDDRVVGIHGDNALAISRYWNTQNGAAPFTREDAGGIQRTNRQYGQVMWDQMPVPRCLITGEDDAYITDDFGATAYVLKQANVFSAGQFLFDLERGQPYGHAYAAGGSSTVPEVVRTKDYGESWETILDGNDFDSLVEQISSLYYDAANDVLYMATTDNEVIGRQNLRVFALDAASQVLAADAGNQTVRPLSLNLGALFNEQVAPRGLAPL